MRGNFSSILTKNCFPKQIQQILLHFHICFLSISNCYFHSILKLKRCYRNMKMNIHKDLLFNIKSIVITFFKVLKIKYHKNYFKWEFMRNINNLTCEVDRCFSGFWIWANITYHQSRPAWVVFVVLNHKNVFPHCFTFFDQISI